MSRLALLLACAPLCLPLAATAQTFDQVAPKPAPQPALPAPLAAPAPQIAVSGNDAVEILPDLKGVVVTSPDGFKPSGVPSPGLRIDHLPLLDQPRLRALLAAYLGKPTSFGDLKQIAQIINQWYVDHHRPFLSVAVPAQDISNGVVQIVVSEYRLGDVVVSGNRWFSSDLIARYVRTAPGQILDLSRLNADLAALNRNPFRHVTMEVEKGANLSQTNLLLQTEDRLPLRIYAGYDNSGAAVLGRNRFNLGAVWGNVFGADQQISYQFTASPDFFARPAAARFSAHSLVYDIPLPWHDRLSIFGSYSQARPNLGVDLGLLGVSGQASLRYAVALAPITFSFLGGAQTLSQDLRFGYDFKTSNNDLSFGGETVSSIAAEVDQFTLTYNATFDGAWGELIAANSLVFSPGNITPQNNNAAIQAQANSPFASAHYTYDTLELTLAARLPAGLTSVTRLKGQLADHNLPPSEQLGAGGAETVRGYDERAANAADGLLLSEEVRSPVFKLAGGLLPAGLSDGVQLHAFWDYASLRDKQQTPGFPAATNLASIGAGLRYDIGAYLDVRLDYGRQLLRFPRSAPRGQLINIAINVGY